jgi:transglutaminase-like putative cysteine protease
MPIFSVRHVTEYRYTRPVSFGEHRLMFRPRDSYDQRLFEATLLTEPEPAGVRWIHDVFGNCVAIIRLSGKSRVLRFETNIRLDHISEPLEFRIEDQALTYPFAYHAEEMSDLKPTMVRHYPDKQDDIGRWARQFLMAGTSTDTGRLLMTMCYAIRESFVYSRRSEQGTQSPLLTLASRKGTCRDFALLMMEAARTLGLAARFVSGYVYVPDRDSAEIRGGGSTHAWCQIYLPGAGWVEFDPTNGIVGNRDLIRVAVARDPAQAIPLSGSYAGKAGDFESMTVEVNVTTGDRTVARPEFAQHAMERSKARRV